MWKCEGGSGREERGGERGEGGWEVGRRRRGGWCVAGGLGGRERVRRGVGEGTGEWWGGGVVWGWRWCGGGVVLGGGCVCGGGEERGGEVGRGGEEREERRGVGFGGGGAPPKLLPPFLFGTHDMKEITKSVQSSSQRVTTIAIHV